MRAWLFDAYPAGEGMALWFLDEDGRPHRFDVVYHPAFYAVGPRAALEALGRQLEQKGLRADLTATTKRELFSGDDLPVTRVTVHRPVDFPLAVHHAARLHHLMLYTCDLGVPQLFFYESGLFPLGRYELETDGTALVEAVPISRPEDLEYEAPPFLVMRLRLEGDPLNPNHGFTSALEASVAGDHVVLSSDRPEDLLRSLNRLLGRYDPDVLLTDWGDSFLLPRLLRLSAQLRYPLALNRDAAAGVRSRRGRSYVTYGQTVYTAGARFLHGRWHLDLRNSFIFSESEMAGLLEIARLARLPVQSLARTSTGTAISSMQLDRAVRDGVLVPWHKSEPEAFKTAAELLLTDKGGLSYQPLVGIYEGVGELDFASMYPTMMARFNISPETVNCGCCAGGTPVPEIGHAICTKRRGLVPQVLDHLLERRTYYKQRKRETSGAERAVYDQRQTALKWCLVTCLEGRTRILHRDGDRWKISPIREIVEQHFAPDQFGEITVSDLAVVGVDEQLRTVVKPVKSVIKSPSPPEMIRMRTRWGREVVMTPNHRCYVLESGRLKVKTADRLRVGDWIPLALTLEGITGEGVRSVDLIVELKRRLPLEDQKRWRVFGRAIRPFVETRYREFCRKTRSEYTPMTIWNWRKYSYVPLSYFETSRFIDHERAQMRIGRGKLTGGLIQKIPARLGVDKELGFLLGFFVGDGSYTGNMIRFDIGGNEYDHLIRLRRILKRKFGVSTRIYKERKANMYVLQVNSAAVVQIFRDVLQMRGAMDRGKPQIPGVILNGPVEAKRGFVLGLIGSDGCLHRAGDEVTVASADRAFTNELGLLYSTLGVDYRLTRCGHTHVIQTKNLIETRKVVFDRTFLSKKHQRVLLYRESRKRRIVGTTLPKSSRQKTIKESSIRSASLERLLNGSFIFAPISLLDRVEPNETFVYCFSLLDEPTAFFIDGSVLTRNSFGYLGYRNARYGRIEAHESTTAYSREILLRAKDYAEDRGFRMLHALVDSMWLQKPGAGQREYDRLAGEISTLTNLPIFVEGVYNWVAFLPSRLHKGVGVPNRYMGAFEDGTSKVRGIEVRRSDVPGLVEETQARILAELFQAGTLEELRRRVPAALAILEETLVRLRDHEVTPGELALTTTLSQEPHEYKTNTAVGIAARLMARSGIRLHPGEAIQYVVMDADAKIPEERVRPLPLLGSDWAYDTERYAELLLRSAETVLELLGYDRVRLRKEVWAPLSGDG